MLLQANQALPIRARGDRKIVLYGLALACQFEEWALLRRACEFTRDCALEAKSMRLHSDGLLQKPLVTLIK
ncbi:hypothetical protein [Methylocystis echinoides]|uniref:hypothetical protein n=1 Tax=Methylocystis echinoides TaxID=29468 RepID=UPI0034491C4F